MELNELANTWRGFQASRVMLTAVELGVFDKLKKPKTIKEAARSLKTSLRGTEVLLKVLVALKVLRKSGGKYSNSQVANKYLVKGAPEYHGDIILHYSSMWNSWSNLTEVVKTGKPSPRSRDPKSFESFIMGMHNLSIKRAPELIKAIGMGGVTHALDLGGGPGTNAMEMAKQIHKMGKVTLFDYPETLKIAQKVARRDGASSAGRSTKRMISYKGGDFTEDPIGNSYDLILVSQIYHAYSEEASLEITKKCHDALVPGGRIAVQEFVVSKDRTSPPGGALFSVNMLVGTTGGNTYHTSHIASWLREAGFVRVKVTPLRETVLVMGSKRKAAG